jgi:hypothetical protein
MNSRTTSSPFRDRSQQAVPLLICAAVIAFCAGCATQRPAEVAVTPSLAGSVDHTYRHPPLFVEESSRLECDVPVKNDTGRTVRFTRVRWTCSCTGAQLAAMQLAPGEETTLHFDIDLRNRTGPQRFVCYVDEKGGAEWVYAVETTLYQRARFAGSGTTHFGMVDPRAEEVRETEFLLYAESAALLPQDVLFTTASDRVQVEPGPGTTEEQPDGVVARRIPLRLRLRAAEAPGLGQASVYARFERQMDKQQVQGEVTWNVRALYSVSPPQVYFGTIDPSSAPAERHVLIQRADGRPLNIQSAKVSCAGVSCQIEKTPDGSPGRLLLILDPKSITGPLAGEVVVETDHPVQPSLKIPVVALLKQLE